MRASTNVKSMACSRRGACALLVALATVATAPATAQAHGPVAPVASSYLAKIGRVPAGLDAQVVDGDQRMWLRVTSSATVVVLDYRGAPYLRFSNAGVEVNQNSAMYYLNQTPVALTPPTNLGPRTPAHWQRVTAGHDYGWHDGRLHALAAIALTPGTSFVGTLASAAADRRSSQRHLGWALVRAESFARVALADRRAAPVRPGCLACAGGIA